MKITMKQELNHEQYLKQVFEAEKTIAYKPVIAKALGSVKAGLLVSQLFYWKDKGKDKDGWIYKTRDDFKKELGLTRQGQETARNIAKKAGVISEVIRGMPPKVHFKINIPVLAKVISDFLEIGQIANRPKTSRFVCRATQNVQTVGTKNDPTTGGKITTREENNQPNFYTENTQESTPENTTERVIFSKKDKYTRFDRP
jgi:hypothetical protein